MSAKMKRREFITLLGSAAAAWPLAARAQQPEKLRTIGFSGQSTRAAESELVAAFTQRLRELGWMENRNITNRISLVRRTHRALHPDRG